MKMQPAVDCFKPPNVQWFIQKSVYLKIYQTFGNINIYLFLT